VVWENKDLGGNQFHDALRKTTSSPTGLGVRNLNKYELKNIQSIELGQEGGGVLILDFYYNC